MVLNQQTIFPCNSNSTGIAASSSSEPSPMTDGPLRQDIQLALSNSADCTYTLVDKPQVHKRAIGDVWRTFKIVQRATDKKMMQFAQCQDCASVFSYKSQNGSNNLKTHSQTCTANADNVAKKRKKGSVNILLKAKFGEAEKKLITKASVQMCALDLRPFAAISGVGFKGLLGVCMNIAQNVQGKIDIDEILPHPSTVSRNVEILAGKVRKCLAEEMKSVMDELVSVSFTTDMTTEDYTKASYSALTSHYIDSEWNLRHPTMGCKEFPQDNRHTATNIKTETLKILGQYGITDETLQDCRCVFTTDNGSGNTGEEGIEMIVSRIACADHRISTILTDVLNKKQRSKDGQMKSIYIYGEQIATITKLIDGVKAVVQYFNQANLQKKIRVSLKSENATRWSSMLTSLSSVLQSFDDIQTVVRKNNPAKEGIISSLDKPLLQDLVEFLCPFKIATKKLEAAKTPTIHMVYRMYVGLLRHCQNNDDDKPDMANLRRLVKTIMIEKLLINEYHVMGAFLDPRQTNKLRASMDNKLGNFVAKDLWTSAIDGSLKDLFQRFQMKQDLDTVSEDEHEAEHEAEEDKEDGRGGRAVDPRNEHRFLMTQTMNLMTLSSKLNRKLRNLWNLHPLSHQSMRASIFYCGGKRTKLSSHFLQR